MAQSNDNIKDNNTKDKLNKIDKQIDELKPVLPKEFKKLEFSDVQQSNQFSEHKVNLSNDIVGKSDIEILDYIINKDDNQLVPWESVQLPSKGLYYDGKVPDGVVQVRPMNIYTEKILSTMRLAKTGQALDMIFKYCVRFPNEDFDPINLLVGDSTFLLFYLRGITFGNLYEFTIKCTDEDCGANQKRVFDLNQLADTIKSPRADIGDEPFPVRLPYLSGIIGKDFIVKVRLLRRYDLTTITADRKRRSAESTEVKLDKITKRFRQTQSVASLNDVIEKNLSLVIVEAMGSKDRFKIDKLVEKLHSSDTAAIRQYLDDISPGVDTNISIVCSECGNEMKVALPITESFFRRTN